MSPIPPHVFRLDYRTVEFKGGCEWTVQTVESSPKSYTCAGCGTAIAAHVMHVAVWRSDGIIGLEGRRHWHKPCWRREVSP